MITYVHHTNTSIILDSSVDTESVEVEWSAWVYKSHICKNNIRYVGVEARSSRRPNGQIGAGRRGIPFLSVVWGCDCDVNSLDHPCCPFGCGTIHDPLQIG